MKARLVKFGEIEVEGERYTHDVVIDGGKVWKRKKGPSKQFRSGPTELCRRCPPYESRLASSSVRVLQPALHCEPDELSKINILRKLKQRFGGETIRDVRFRVG